MQHHIAKTNRPAYLFIQETCVIHLFRSVEQLFIIHDNENDNEKDVIRNHEETANTNTSTQRRGPWIVGLLDGGGGQGLGNLLG